MYLGSRLEGFPQNALLLLQTEFYPPIMWVVCTQGFLTGTASCGSSHFSGGCLYG